MKKEAKKPVNVKKKTHPKIVVTALVALACVALALFFHWTFILPAVFLWWINKKSIKKHFEY